MSPRIPLLFSALAGALLLVSCSAPSPGPQTAQPAPTGSPSTTVPATSGPVEHNTPRPRADPTCETIITAGTVEALTSQGWTVKQQELRIGEILVEDGLLCMWADYSTASDHGQMYGWGTLDARTADSAKANLQRDGWLRSSRGEVVYYTEDPAYAISTDEDGFGMTYEFGDGWVKFADTKQGLLLIEWEG